MSKLMQDILALAAREVAKDLARQALKHGVVTAWSYLGARVKAAPQEEVRCIQRSPMEGSARERT